MEESQCSFRQKPASAKPCCGPFALDIHRARQRNFASRGSRRRQLHSPLWPDESRCLGAQKRQCANSSSTKREVEQPEHRKSRSSSRRRSVARRRARSAAPYQKIRSQVKPGSPLHAVALAIPERRRAWSARPTKETQLKTPDPTATQS